MTKDATPIIGNLYPSEKCLHEIFQAQARKTPNQTALVYKNTSLSFLELNQKANQLGHYLRALGVGQDELVAICMERSPEMIIAVFGILKAGGAYVPIDVDYPNERRKFMLEDSQAKVLLTQEDLLDNFENTTAHTVCLDTDWQEIEETFPKNTSPKSGVNPENLAYTIYTSGSTGRPKGVMIEHRHIVHQLQGQQAIAPTPIHKMLLTCSISFDVSVLTIFWSLLQGATLILPQQGEEKDIQKISQLINKNEVSHLLTLPSLHTLILEQADPQELRTLRLINVSGEVCPTSLAQNHEKALPWCQLYNLYGPTEAAVNCTYFTLPKGFAESKVPIGRPILNYELFILDESLNQVKDNKIGEIHIGSTQPVVGRGYWNRPELTAQKFIPNPYQSTRGGATLYKTGDLGRWMPDGNIEFLGRADFQVKYRGFRIELGEIETAISHHPEVKETVVLLRNQEEIGRQKLVAYVTLKTPLVPEVEQTNNKLDNYENKIHTTTHQNPNDTVSNSPSGAGSELTASEIRNFLANSLPEYMLPSHFVFLEKFPLTTNGKFDRKALPEPTEERPQLAQNYEAPTTDLEKKLTQIWEKTLEIHPIGRHDKFFELGGNSMLAAKFIGSISRKMDASIFITTIFDHPTVAAYADFLEEAYPEKVSSLSTKTVTADTSKIAVSYTEKSENYRQTEVANTRKLSVTRSIAPASKRLFIEEIEPENQPLEQTKKLSSKQIQTFRNYLPKTLKSQGNQPINKKNPKAVFILAPPRSGTTLLRVMLAGHPKLFAANELQLLNFENLQDRKAAYSGKFTLWKEGLVRAVMELNNCDAEKAQRTIANWEEQNWTTKAVFSHLQAKINNRILVDKSPQYAIDQVALQKSEKDFDEAIYIHLVRHPYAMAVSFENYKIEQALFLKENPYSGKQLGELVWLESHQNIVSFLENVPKERHIQVRYEDLVCAPEKIMRQICQKIGIDYHENLVQPYLNLDQKMVDGIHANSRSMGDTNFDKKTSIDPTMADKWKGVLTDNFLSDESWQWIEKLGYPTLKPKKEDVQLLNLGDSENYADLDTPTNSENGFAESIDYQEINEQPTPRFLKKNADKQNNSNDIAIIGMSCRVAGASNIWEFWQNLIDNKDVSRKITIEDLEKAGEDLLDFSKENYVKRTLTLDHADCFDASFFGYLPKEAKMMDPQHRIFLETAYAALEQAGYTHPTYGGKIGVFGGVARNAYFTNNVATNPKNLKNAGNYTDMMAAEKAFSITRVAYKLNLKGPAVNVQTACSTSGVAVHLACQSLHNGDSDIVLVGGGRIQPDLMTGYTYKEGGPISPDGYLRAFDAKANGMVQGNGMAMLVLKKLDKAQQDGDHIWAVIKGSAVNNDGAEKIGFTAPSIKGQTECIQSAQQNAGIEADSISYIEAHGTGTMLGDPIEIQSLTQAFKQQTDKKQFCAIGSVKTNVGHLDAGACAIGMIKTALALYFEKLPATANFQQPNPQIDFKDSPFFVNEKLTEWKRTNEVRRAGVSAFGLGGTNAHIILEEVPIPSDSVDLQERQNLNPKTQKFNDTSTPELLLLSAKTQESLEEISAQFSEYFRNSNQFSLAEIAHTLAVGRQPFNFRKALITNDLNTASELVRKTKGANLINGVTQSQPTKVVFMFPGGGAQYVNMARDLWVGNTFFKTELQRCFDFLKREFLFDFAKEIFTNSLVQSATLTKPSIALPALFSIEFALARLWENWGIQPTAMIGHSMGEYTAACLAGVMTLEETLRIVTLRGQLFETLPAEGGMLSVPLSEEELRPRLNGHLSLAVINKPNACVVSGKAVDMEKLQRELAQEGVEAKRIRIDVAAHSTMIDPILEEFEKCLQLIDFQEPTIPFVSNVTGDWITAREATSVDYWLQHLRGTVRFSDGLETLFEQKNRIVLEVGPGQTLSTFARQHPAKNKGQQILASTRHPKEQTNDVAFIYKTVAKLWVTGQEINWQNFYHNKSQKRVPLPTYAFDRKRYWIEKKTERINETFPEVEALESALIQQLEKEAPMQNNANLISDKGIAQSRLENLITEIKTVLYELSGLEPEEMDGDATFLELGFDSLFLSQVIIKINNVFETKISFRQLFEEASTIVALAEVLDELLPEEKFRPEAVAIADPSLEVRGENGFSQNGNGYSNGYSNGNGASVLNQNGNGRSNGNGYVSESSNGLIINSLSANGNHSNVENLIQQQLLLMQQQLNLLQNKGTTVFNSPFDTDTVEGYNSSGNGHSNGKAPAKSNGNYNGTNKPKPSSNGNKQPQKELKITRTSKGVTAKMGNYKNISTSNDLTLEQQENLQRFIEKYIEKTASSKIMASRHRQFYADPRSVTGFSKLWKEIVYQIGHKKSKGAKIWDVDDNEYIDFVMSYGVALFGHMPDFVEEAVAKQLKTGNSLDVLPPESTEIARIIAEISGQDRVTLANTGTEAVLGAVRAARRYSGKDKIAVFDTDYHGMIDQFMVRGVFFKDKTKSLPQSPGISNHIAENTLILDYDDPHVLEKLAANMKELAAVVIEPVQAQNPHWQHGDLIKKIRELTEKQDVALIFDEVINGFRLSQKGAQGWYDVEADIVAYGKSISGGMPLAAVAGKEKYMEGFDGGLWQFGDDSGPEASVTYFASTFIKNPLSVSAAYAAMSEIERRGASLQHDLNVKAARFAARVREIFLRTGAPLFIQCSSSIFMIKPADKNPLTRLFHYFLRFRGVNMRERPCFICTEHSEDDFQKAYEAIEGAIQDMFKAGLIGKYEGEDLNVIVNMPVHLQVSNTQLPLTEGQKEIFVNTQFSQEANLAYNIGTEIQLQGALDVERMQVALQDLVDRHESLRMSFAADGSSAKIEEKIELNVPFFDLSGLTEKKQKCEVEKWHLEEANTPFDLQNAPLIRAKILKFSSTHFSLLVTVHHIVVDGWSLGILTNELGEVYSNISREVGRQFTDFIKDQIVFKQAKESEEILRFWKNKFATGVPQNNFPTDNPRPKIKTYQADCQRLKLDSASFQKIQKVAAKQGSTSYFFLFGAFQSFVARLAQQDELTIGIVAAGQNLSGNNKLVGHLANLLPIKMKVDRDASFANHLKQVRGELLDAFDHQNFTFGELVRSLKLERNTSQNPLVSIVFNMDSPLENLNYGATLNVDTRPIQKQYEAFDFFINMKPEKGELTLEWFYNRALFKAKTIENRLIEFQVFLNEILENPQQSISTLPLMKKDLGATTLTTPQMLSKRKKPQNFIQLFENQSITNPENNALQFDGKELTYSELNKKSNQLAQFLIEKGVQQGRFVGVFLERSEHLLIGLLGVLKAGAAYLPLDIANPKERLAFILNDVEAEVILTQKNLVKQLPENVGKSFCIEDFVIEKDDFSEENLDLNIEGNAPAYIIYTSGSTGKPKGIRITHSTISEHLVSMRKVLNFKSKDAIFSVISASFDPSVQDFFLPLISGAKLIVADEKTLKDGRLLAEKLNQSEATWMAATPPTWRMLRLVNWQGKKDLNLISTGEALSKELAGELLNCGKKLWNFYGPTETTIYATIKQVEAKDLQEQQISNWVSIGKSLPETPVYILDSNLQPLPPGTPGEIFIGGFRVAEGYHQRPDLTAEVFLENPFKKGTKFYRTGDLGYQSNGGDIFYINRKDNQVKLRGYRIELGEIEAKIRAFSEVDEAVVMVREDVLNDKKLVAYVKAKTTDILVLDELKKQLKSSLPDYMIPSDFVVLEKFPLTSSGKINRRQLPKPEKEILVKNALVEVIRTETEEKLSKIWSRLLAIPQVGLEDNFYELGGHSLLAVGMMVEIEKQFAVRLPLVTFIENATITAIGNLIDTKLGKFNGEVGAFPQLAVPKLPISEKIIPLTEGQSEIWVSHNLNEEAAKTFNIGSEIQLQGAVDLVHLKGAIQDVFDRHEALRTAIGKEGKQQKILSEIEAEIAFFNYSDTPNEEADLAFEQHKKEAIETPFDLQKAPLARFAIFQFSEHVFSLVFTMHHILLDGWSLGVLTKDLGWFYQKRAGKNVKITEQPSQLSDYVSFLDKYRKSADYQASANYWKNQFQTDIPSLKLPSTKKRNDLVSFAADEASVILSHSFVQKLQAAARQNRTSFYSYMFAAFQAYLGRIVAQEKFVLGVSVSGKSIVQFNDLVAHRTNLLPMVIEPNNATDFASYLQASNRQLLTAFDHQDYTLGTLVKELNLTRDNSRHPIVNTVFNMETMIRKYDFGEVEVKTEFIAGNHKLLDLIVHIKPHTEGYEFKWIYNKSLFEKAEVENRLVEFDLFLQEILAKPNLPLQDLNLLSEKGLNQVQKFGQGEIVENFDTQPLYHWLEKSAEKTPENIAISFANRFLTYQELNEKANQLANFLIDNDLPQNAFVGICLERSENILIAIYAVLKAGGTYVPIDPRNPVKRIQLTLEDANCTHLISESVLTKQAGHFGGKTIYLDSQKMEIAQRSKQNLLLTVASQDLAYVIYTSGSTGKPKGVGIRHESVCNTLGGINRHLELTEEDVFYSVSSMSFDMCIPDYFLSIKLGAQLIMADENVKKDGILLREDLEKYQPTFMQATPTTWKILLVAGWEGYSQLKVLAGGEGFAKDLATDLLSKCHRVWNGYGPTEATIYTTFKEVTWENLPEMADHNFIPIGRPIANVNLQILDKNKQPVPVGVSGELYIGGAGVANGYLRRENLTKQFFSQQWAVGSAQLTEGKVYKTGDLVRYLSNGDIDFLGRIDNQLKIRGFRVELGEIEACLQDIDGILQTAVLLAKNENGREILIGYFTAKSHFEWSEMGLKKELRQSLPGYMIPSVFMELDAFPMSNSAKIDRKALPKPDFAKRQKENFVLPKNETEIELLQLWKTVLGLEKISTNEDFFELGGHSLLAVGLMTRIQQKFGKKISVTVLFQNSTIEQLAALIEDKKEEKKTNWTSLIPVKTKGKKPPIYLIHGGGLHVLFYQALAKHLDENQPVYALQAHGLDGKNEPFDRIEEMAAHYIKEILEQNPDGPYCLAGYSLGGLITYEMARQLREMGKTVNLVAMFDAVAKYNWEGNDKAAKWRKKMKKANFNMKLMMRDPIKTAKYKAEVLKMQRHHLKGEINVAHGQTADKPDENEGGDAGRVVFEKSMQAFENYVLQPLPIRVDLFKAKEQMFFLHDPELYGWGHFAEAGVAVHELEGNHMNMFSAAHGESLGTLLQAVLDERNTPNP